MRSACFPGDERAELPSSPSARAPPSVASSRASAAVSASGRPSRARAAMSAARSSSNMSNDGVEAGLSVPRPTRIPARAAPRAVRCRTRASCSTGAMDYATSCSARSAISSASTLTQWLRRGAGRAVLPGEQRECRSRRAAGRASRRALPGARARRRTTHLVFALGEMGWRSGVRARGTRRRARASSV